MHWIEINQSKWETAMDHINVKAHTQDRLIAEIKAVKRNIYLKYILNIILGKFVLF